MKFWLFAAALICFCSNANATWRGRFDLTPAVSPIIIRELHDGQWLAGITKENLWHLDRQVYGGNCGGIVTTECGIEWQQLFHVGVFQAWNAERGNASFGTVAGIDLPVKLGPAIAAVGDALDLHDTFKPLQYIGSALSLDAIGGYRPIHTSDVNGNWVYGLGLRLNVAFGLQELQKGI